MRVRSQGSGIDSIEVVVLLVCSIILSKDQTIFKTIGADSRTSTGMYVANRASDKITQLTDNIYLIQQGRPATVKAASNIVRNFSYNKNRFQTGMIVGGWDKYEGGKIYVVPLGGTIIEQPFAIGEEEEDEDEGENDLEAWERAYADDRSWECLQEDDSSFLRPIDTNILHHDQYRCHLRSVSATARIQKGLIRYLYLAIDLSKAAGEMDFIPSRMAVVAKYAEAFIREFFDQNPLSHIGLIAIKDGVSQCLTDLGGKS
ncbi:hypothetical protein GIB67_034820 [Kingdonia uniflora]|uniref:Ssl1-like domain-containing protein n=1 Tax=Kingdonia uniflora TaxID=39325 RepID=A0A7J7MEC9_9MAGN|nr:hypothetical protein GIB67_034820 [Kingdonia uniflora]